MAVLKKIFVGGMRAETLNYTFPFISLVITAQFLKIKVLGFDRFIFRPDQVLGFKVRCGGIQIFHNILNYPTLIIFWGNAYSIAVALHEAGYKRLEKGEGDDQEYKLHVYLAITGGFLLLSILALGTTLMILSK